MGSDRFRLQKLQSRRTGWPAATLALYGPNDAVASKMVITILKSEGAEPESMQTWRREGGDIRDDARVTAEARAFLDAHGVRRVMTADRIIGCPHQEGIDYEGRYCPDPACGFWVGIDRWTGETEH